MYTVVVADDEEELRRAIIRRIDWEAIGFQVVGEAENGVEALELVEKMEPDLLLTDIKMPFVSGIELARQVREIRPTTQIVFLSGFDEFKFAQQAIQYNIISYLLKPISMSDLSSELKSIKEKIDRLFWEFSHQKEKQEEKTEFIIPLLLDGFPLADSAIEDDVLEEYRNANGLPSSQQKEIRYAVMVSRVTDQEGKICTRADMVHAVDSILKKYVDYRSFFWNGRIISLLISTASGFDKYLHILVGEVIQSTERIRKMNCSIGVSRITEKLSGCHDAYIEAMNAISYASKNGSSVHYIADEEHEDKIDAQGILKIVTEVESLIRGSSVDEITVYMEELFHRIHSLHLSGARIKNLMLQILAAVCKTVYAIADSEEIEEMEELQKNMLLQNLFFREGTLAEWQSRLTEFCIQARELIGSQRKKSSRILCEKTLNIIETDFGNGNLSLVSVSNRISVSPNYLSALIKKETGKTFIDILTARRMEAARDMLLCTTMKIREISEKCGYNDQHYFSYCFKKFSGVSPNALRQQQKKEEDHGE